MQPGGDAGYGIDLQTMTGVTCATFPTSSSACIIRLMRATGNFVLILTSRTGMTFGFGMMAAVGVGGSTGSFLRLPRPGVC
jgi:hypothetical protein